MIITIIILVLLAFLLWIFFKSYLYLGYLVRVFRRNNVIVYGKKGTGKDMLFQAVINKRKEFHYSNINYNKKTLPITLNEITLYPNTYENMINGTIEKVEPNLAENYDIYLSDAGVMLPSQYDYLLHKKYPSLPLLYALQRHLYNSNFHANVQSLSRIWKPLRELADGYIKAEKTIFIFGFYIIFFTYYDRYETAERSMLPMSKKLINGFNNGLVEQYNATNGIIKEMYIIGRKKCISYDTRYFKSVFLKDKTNEGSVSTN
jgi:hypothetical protein